VAVLPTGSLGTGREGNQTGGPRLLFLSVLSFSFLPAGSAPGFSDRLWFQAGQAALPVSAQPCLSL
jgi:hypothetical protein